MKITGNTILVTGGTSGIGRALAEALHDRGNRVIVVGRRQELLDEIASRRPGIGSLCADLDGAADLARIAEEVRSRYPDLNVVLANAGISRMEDVTVEGWDTTDAEAIVATNVVGTMRVAAAFLSMLKDRPDATFMATTSNLAFVPAAAFPTYCASKAFLHSWLQSLRHQLRHSPVEVLELSPTYVQTELIGPEQANDPQAMPLGAFVDEVMALLDTGDHPDGEVLVRNGCEIRSAERDGRFDEIFAAINGA